MYIFLFSLFLDTFFMYLRSCDHVVIANLVLVDIYIYIYTHLRLSLQFFNLSLYVLFLYSLYAHAYYILYAILYFCFTLRCLDEFCLKCFKNTGCQSLLTINSLLAKFFKSSCWDIFYCIQQVNMSWVIYDFCHMFIYLFWFCHGLPKGKIVRTYVIQC